MSLCTCHDCLVHIGNEEKADSHGQGNFVDRVFEKLCEFHILEPLNTLMKSTKVQNLQRRHMRSVLWLHHVLTMLSSELLHKEGKTCESHFKEDIIQNLTSQFVCPLLALLTLCDALSHQHFTAIIMQPFRQRPTIFISYSNSYSI